MSVLIKDGGREKSENSIQHLLSIRSNVPEVVKKEPSTEEPKTSTSEIPPFKKTNHVECKGRMQMDC